jgi:uncharacterized protein with beta-barrel porin domain
VSFAEIPSPTATFFGPSEGHDSAIISAGVSAQWTPAMTIYVNYDGQLARGNYDSNAVTGGVRIGFLFGGSFSVSAGVRGVSANRARYRSRL